MQGNSKFDVSRGGVGHRIPLLDDSKRKRISMGKSFLCLVLHVFSWQGAKVGVGLARIAVPRNETPLQDCERGILHSSVAESWWFVFNGDARPPFVGG